jgi:hypothetical protein
MMAGNKDTVSFEVVVKSLYHVTQKMDEIPRKALLMCTDGGEERVLDYPQFSSLLLNVVAAGSLNFHEVANSMTLTFCKDDVSRTDLTDLFVGNDMYRAAVETPDNGISTNQSEVVDALQYGRMSRLFDLWDMDHSGDLDFEEVVLGFSKYHGCTSYVASNNAMSNLFCHRKIPRGQVSGSNLGREYQGHQLI